MRVRAASARLASRDSRTTLAPFSRIALASASPMPIEAPVITAILPVNSMPRLYSVGQHVSSYGVQCRESQPVSTEELLKPLLPLFPLDLVLFPGTPLPL